MRETRLVLKLIGQGQGFEVRKEDEKGFRIIGFLILFLVMIPSCVAAGGLTYAMTLAFVLSGGKTEGLLFFIQFLSAFALVFGFSVVMNSFYFAGDLEILLPLPISPRSIISSKFIITYLAESGMEFLVIISAWAGYLLAAGGGIKDIILCLFATVTLPVLPLAYCGIFSILIMFFFSGFTNRKTMNFFLAVLSIVLLLAAVLSFAGLEGLTIENFIDMLMQDRNRFMNIMNVVFYPGYILMKAVAGGSALLIAEYVLINLAALLVFALLADRLYMPGLMAFRSASDKKRAVQSRKVSFKRRSPVISLLKKEVRMLLRTPGYITNCLLINLFWPVIVVIILLMQKGSDTIGRFIFTYHFGYILYHAQVL